MATFQNNILKKKYLMASFHVQFQYVAKNIEGCLSFFFILILFSQIWLAKLPYE
jgi:hypothetical protein